MFFRAVKESPGDHTENKELKSAVFGVKEESLSDRLLKYLTFMFSSTSN